MNTQTTDSSSEEGYLQSALSSALENAFSNWDSINSMLSGKVNMRRPGYAERGNASNYAIAGAIALGIIGVGVGYMLGKGNKEVTTAQQAHQQQVKDKQENNQKQEREKSGAPAQPEEDQDDYNEPEKSQETEGTPAFPDVVEPSEELLEGWKEHSFLWDDPNSGVILRDNMGDPSNKKTYRVLIRTGVDEYETVNTQAQVFYYGNLIDDAAPELVVFDKNPEETEDRAELYTGRTIKSGSEVVGHGYKKEVEILSSQKLQKIIEYQKENDSFHRLPSK